jgi:hypothetical protein
MLKLRNNATYIIFFFYTSLCFAQHIERGQSNNYEFNQYFEKGFQSIVLENDQYQISKVLSNIELHLEGYQITSRIKLVRTKVSKCDSVYIELPLLFEKCHENTHEMFIERQRIWQSSKQKNILVNGEVITLEYDTTFTQIGNNTQKEVCRALYITNGEDVLNIEFSLTVEYNYSENKYLSGLGEYSLRTSAFGVIPKTSNEIDTIEVNIKNKIPNSIPVYYNSTLLLGNYTIKKYNILNTSNKLNRIRFNPDNYLTSRDYLQFSMSLSELEVSDSKWNQLLDKNTKTSCKIDTSDIIEISNLKGKQVYEIFLLPDSSILKTSEKEHLNISFEITTELYDKKSDSTYTSAKTKTIRFYSRDYHQNSYGKNLGYATFYTVGNDPYYIQDFFNNDKKEPYLFESPEIRTIKIRLAESFSSPIKISEVFILKVQE